MAEPVECTSCGAMLPPPDGEGHVACLSCGRRARSGFLARHLPHPPPPPAPSAPPSAYRTTPGPGQAGPGPVPGQSGAKGCGVAVAGCGTTLGILVATLVLFGAIGLVLIGRADDSSTEPRSATSAFTNVIVLEQATTLLPADDEGDELVIALLQRTVDSDYDRSLAALSLSDTGATVEWESEPLGRETTDVRATRAGSTIFAAVADRLLAFDADTGEVRWETQLSDTVPRFCATCFAATGGSLLVQTADGEIARYGTGSSERTWSRRLTSTVGSMVVTGGSVIVVDDPAGAEPVTVEALDPADGRTRGPLRTPCPDRQSSLPTSVTPVPGSDRALALFGYSRACAVVWDGATATTGPDLAFPDEVALDAANDAPPTFHDDTAIVATRGGPVVLDLGAGTVRVLDLLPDTSAITFRVVDELLLATTESTRGTPVAGLVSWNLASGDLRWTAELPDRPVLIDPRDTSSATVFPDRPGALLLGTDDGISIATFTAGDDGTVSVRTVDPDDGTIGDPVLVSDLDDLMSSIRVTMLGTGPERFAFVINWNLYWGEPDGRGPLQTFPD